MQIQYAGSGTTIELCITNTVFSYKSINQTAVDI